MIAEKKIKRSIGLIVMSVVYFLFACWMLKTYGLGIMSNRFDSMIGEGESLLGIIKTVLLNPGYSIRQIFTDKDNTPAKLFYFCQLLFPLAFLPFMTKKYARLILILPIFLNLLTNYLYQYDISFQYSFGIGTLLLYLSLINVKDMPDGKKNFATALSAGLTVMLFFMLIMPKYQSYIKNYDRGKDLYARMDHILSEIPEDKSVSASTFLIPNLSKREVLYETFYHKEFDTDLIILDFRSPYAAEAREIAAGCEENGYKLEFYEEGCLMIYSAPEK